MYVSAYIVSGVSIDILDGALVEAEKKRGPARLGSYEIIRPLARGGMAELFLARAIGPAGFEKVVVLKRVLPHFAENPRFVRSFLDEAKLVAGFDHPNIAHVYDMGMADGSYFFTMEFVQGIDLHTILKRCVRDHTQLPISLAILIARNMASALHYAHERRTADGKLLDVVHRDVSPSNIIVSFDGGSKLIDFGIAKATSSSLKTQTGALKGKISYMSPEQAKGTPIDRRTDVFALGIVLWEMLTCRRLYKSDNDMATIQRIIYEPPPSPVIVRSDCPPALERIVLRALALDVKARYQTALELEVDLEELAHEHRIKQSTIELNAYMHRVFEAEVKASKEVQLEASTVTDGSAYVEEATHSDGSRAFPVLPPPEDDTGEVPALAWPPSVTQQNQVEDFGGNTAATTPDRPTTFPATPIASTTPPITSTEPPITSTEWVRPRRGRLLWTGVGVVVAASALAMGMRRLARHDDAPKTAPTPIPVAAPAVAAPAVAAPAPATPPVPAPVAALPTAADPATAPATAPAADKAALKSEVVKKRVVTKPPATKKEEPRPVKEPKPAEPKPKEPKPKEPKPYDPNDPFPPSP